MVKHFFFGQLVIFSNGTVIICNNSRRLLIMTFVKIKNIFAINIFYSFSYFKHTYSIQCTYINISYLFKFYLNEKRSIVLSDNFMYPTSMFILKLIVVQIGALVRIFVWYFKIFKILNILNENQINNNLFKINHFNHIDNFKIKLN